MRTMKKLFFFIFSIFLIYDLKAVEKMVVSPRSEIIDRIGLKELEFYINSTSSNSNIIPLKCFSSLNDKYYIGLFHGLVINESVKNVANILEDFSNYPQIFHTVVESNISKKINENNLIVQFEDKAPAFFLPNTKYEMFYSIERIADKRLYKYHLSSQLKQNDIIFSDGLIFLNEVQGKTYFYELDFFKADWGLVEKMASAKIWPESVHELVWSDYELKLKAENHSLSPKEIKNQSKKILNDDEIKKCINSAVVDKEFLKSFHLIP